MAQLEELICGVKIRGILPNAVVTLVEVKWSGCDAVTIIYREDNSDRVGSCLLYRSDQPRLEIARQILPWRFDADGDLFRLVSEAQRIRLAHLFDPFLAIHTSQVEPYPHQITAVYQEMLPRQPLRFLLAEVNIRSRLNKDYPHICFDKTLTYLKGKPTCEFIYPGHPLLDATIDLTLEPLHNILKQGSILVDENDPGDEVRILFYLEHAIKDARENVAGNSRLVSMQMLYIEIDGQAQAHSVGYAPYLDYRSLQESEKTLVLQIIREGSSILQRGIDEQAQTYAISYLSRQHYQEVQQRRIERVTKTINAVEVRLNTEINYWEDRAEKLKLQEQTGKVNARLNYDNAKRRVNELKGRLQKRLQELEQERHLLPQQPFVIGGALIVPRGLIQRLQGDNQTNFTNLAKEKASLEKQAIAAVIAAERRQGFEPKDVSADRCGYDIESRISDGGKLRFIKVKIRIDNASTVAVSRNEIITGLNKPDSFILALVEVVESAQLSNYNIRYIRRPFHRYPEAVTMQYTWQQLWQLGKDL